MMALHGHQPRHWTTTLSSTSVASQQSLSTSGSSSLTASSSAWFSATSSHPTTTGTLTTESTGIVPTQVQLTTQTFTTPTTIPVTIILGSSTIISSTISLVESTTTRTVGRGPTASAIMQSASSTNSGTCAGQGLDTSAQGVIATVVITALVGILIWLLFAVLRPRFPQLYALREWFTSPDIRPRHLGPGFFAFLFPKVPLVPDMPPDSSDLGKSPAIDATLFPSDEELSQRTLWIAFLIALGWTVLGLAGALPLYMVSTPCVADSTPQISHGGRTSTLTDLSLLRLLKLLDSNSITTSGNVVKRAIIDGVDQKPKAKTRLIILTVLVIVLGVFPALWKIAREFNAVVAYRNRWLDIRCSGVEMGWLSLVKAPGFKGWSEGRIKDFLLKNGLTSGFERSRNPRVGRMTDSTPAVSRYDREGRPANHDAEEAGQADIDVDIHGFFTITETSRLANLIEERDRVLNELETAEAQYIAGFQMLSRNSSQAEFNPEDLEPPVRRGLRISRPKALGGGRPRVEEHVDSHAPTAYIAPSSYYKLRGVQGVSEGRVSEQGMVLETFSQSIGRGVVGSRFQEVDSDHLALGSKLKIGASGKLAPPTPSSFGEFQVPPVTKGEHFAFPSSSTDGAKAGTHRAEPSSADPRRTDDRRDSFPMRSQTSTPYGDPDARPPFHLRAQDQAPFVRPLSGYHETLGLIYNTITASRSRLKALNVDIAEAQQDGFNDIADGARVKGWMIMGKGVRFLPGIEMIEGRSKEDVRWHELQEHGGIISKLLYMIVVAMIGLCLGASLVAVSGLALAGAPNVAYYLPFLKALTNPDNLGAGIATTLAPAVAASVFIAIALVCIHYATRHSGVVSVSGMRIRQFKATFAVLVIVCAAWLIAVGAVLFSMDALANGTGAVRSVSDGAVYAAILLMLIVINLAVISPGLLLLQPIRLWRVLRAERRAATPRQKFRALYPKSYNPSFALGCCVLGVVFACTFSVIFPLIGPPVVLLLILTLIAHRYLVGYAVGRASVGQTGGLLHLWVLKRFGTLLALQPFLLGLILLSCRIWGLAGVLLGTAALIVVCVEVYTSHKTRLPGPKSLSPITRDSLEHFETAAHPRTVSSKDEDGASLVSSLPRQTRRPRTSIASVLDMMSLTLAVMPSTSRTRGPVPLATEAIDDRVSTERAARTRPGAPPHLPFVDRAEDTAGMLYSPELLAPQPIIWLPNDQAGIARSEAYDLQRFHDFEVTMDAIHEDRKSIDGRSHRRRASSARRTPGPSRRDSSA